MRLSGLNILVTGGCGFIGSRLVKTLVARGNCVTVVDNLSSGKLQFLKDALTNAGVNAGKSNLNFVRGNILNTKLMEKLIGGKNMVFHFAAHPDVRKSLEQVFPDFKVNTYATLDILNLMAKARVKRMVFASSAGTIYGETSVLPTPESHPLLPISHYGASKAAAEMYLSSFADLHGMTCITLRFGNIYGPPSNHGVMSDFFRKLKKNPGELEILGNGLQKKSYLYIDDCINATLLAAEKSPEGFHAYNVSEDKNATVLTIAKHAVKACGLKNVQLRTTGGKRGWPGDVALTRPSVQKLKALGWKQKVSLPEGIAKYMAWLLAR